MQGVIVIKLSDPDIHAAVQAQQGNVRLFEEFSIIIPNIGARRL